MPLGGSDSVSDEGAAWSALAGLTPLEWNSEVPESDVHEALTRRLTSHILLGWIDGMLCPLPSVALRPTLGGLRSGGGTSSRSDKDVHQCLPVEPSKQAAMFQNPEPGGWRTLITEDGCDLLWDQVVQGSTLLSLVPGRHPQGGPDLPVHPYEANTRTLK